MTSGFINGAVYVDDAPDSRINLGLEIGSDVQAYSSILSAIAAGTYPGSGSITTLGTITTGVWNATPITNTYLANSSLTINGTTISLGASGTVTAAAGTLTGTTLNSSVVTSSLTSVGTITSGVWNGTSIANAYLANSSLTVNGTSIALGASGTVTAAASTLTGTTLASNVVSSSLTSFGTIPSIVVTGGTINGAVIGGSTPAAATFTTIGVNTGITLANNAYIRTATSSSGSVLFSAGSIAGGGYLTMATLTGGGVATLAFTQPATSTLTWDGGAIGSITPATGNFTRSTISPAGLVTAPTATTTLNAATNATATANLALTGTGFNSGSGTEGVSFSIGVNSSGNRQLWIGDTAALAVNGTNTVIRMSPQTGGNSFIDAIATNGTGQSLILQPSGGPLGVSGNLNVTGALTTGPFTFTSYSPTIGDGTNNFGLTSQNGYYVVIGNMTYFAVWIQWNSKGSAVAGSNVKISLPSTINATSARYSFSLGFTNGISITTQRSISSGGDSGANYAWLFLNTTGTCTIATVSQLNTSGELQLSGWYRT